MSDDRRTPPPQDLPGTVQFLQIIGRIQIVAVLLALGSCTVATTIIASWETERNFGLAGVAVWALVGLLGLIKHVYVSRPRLIEVLCSVWMIALSAGAVHSAFGWGRDPGVAVTVPIWIAVCVLVGSSFGWRAAHRLDETRPWWRIWHLVKGWMLAAGITCPWLALAAFIRGSEYGRQAWVSYAVVPLLVLTIVLVIPAARDVIRIRRKMRLGRSDKPDE